MGKRSNRRGPLSAFLLLGILGWTSARVAGSELRSAGRNAFWRGSAGEALSRYQAARRIDPLDLTAAEGERDVLIGALESPEIGESQLGLGPAEVGARGAGIVADLVEMAPLHPGTWAGVSDFYGSLKPVNQRQRVYSLEEISPRPEENLEPEDILQIRALEIAIQIDPNGFYYRDVVGDLEWGLGLRQMALDQYHEAVVLAPDTTQHLFITTANLDRDLAEVTVAGMRRSVEPPRNADPETVFRKLGILLLRLRRFPEAREAFWTAEEASHAPGYLAWQARAEVGRGNLEDATQLYRKALFADNLDPGDRFQIHLDLGGILGTQGRNREAATELRNALVLQPREPRALRALGRLYESLGLPEQAEEQYLRAAGSAQDRVSPVVNLVEFYRRTGKPGQALPWARKLTEMEPDEPVYRELLHRILLEVEGGSR